ncbi:NAD dependent epimerase/dehydratase family protein [Rhizodiscina lignyota]|uniref:NAD dependent epimerase/dehydratase family protein n=1 Tax=Rhizodiscina lignyota TaxID=1504668 RepID=A0A9P4MAY2_9PEZI|nr:NAD dependent epimerase/dehydratase family protein [Rhizodiscina lignyota]
MANKRFLVVGGTSLVGSHLAEVLLQRGTDEVVLFDNFSLSSPEVIRSLEARPGVRVVRGDALKLAQVIDAMRDVDGVFMLAAFLTLPLSQNPPAGAEVNVMGLVNVLEAARLLGGKKVVLASSIAVYGTNIDDVVDESTAFGSAGLSPAFGAYAASKLMGENLGGLYAQKYAVEFCSVRFSTVYGENQHSRGVNALYILEALKDVCAGRAPRIRGDGTEAHDYIHAADAALGMAMAMEKGGVGERYNLSTFRATSVKEIVDLVLKEYDSSLTPETVTDTRTT